MSSFCNDNHESDSHKDGSYVYKNQELFYARLLLKEIENENIEEVKWLLVEMNVNPNVLCPARDISPMHLLAAMENEYFSVEVIHLALRDCNGDPNLRSRDGLTPVHLAAIWGRCKVLEVLLNFGGDPDLVDYKMFFNAEDLALWEHQWQAHAVLATFAIMNENEDSNISMDGSRPCPYSSNKRSDCEHQCTLNKLKGLFNDPGKLDDIFLLEDSRGGSNETNKSLEATDLKYHTKVTQTPSINKFMDNSLQSMETPERETNLKFNSHQESQIGLPSNNNTKTEQNSDFSPSKKGSLHKLTNNAKVFGKTTTSKFSQLFHFLTKKSHIISTHKKNEE